MRAKNKLASDSLLAYLRIYDQISVFKLINFWNSIRAYKYNLHGLHPYFQIHYSMNGCDKQGHPDSCLWS